MTNPAVKICGLSTPDTLDAAMRHGATHVGFVFFPKSPRHLGVEQAAALAQQTPAHVQRVSVLVDPDDALLEMIAGAGAANILQLHGAETPARVAQVKARFHVPVWKAIGVRTSADLDAARAFESVADLLLFDAKPPTAAASDAQLPGGLGLRFDWRLLEGRQWQSPWGLSGGLDAANVAEAIRQLSPDLVDVSSGVEDAPGLKSVAKIESFLKAARS
jgi:phosphoribosylanthranilate isomerase